MTLIHKEKDVMDDTQNGVPVVPADDQQAAPESAPEQQEASEEQAGTEEKTDSATV